MFSCYWTKKWTALLLMVLLLSALVLHHRPYNYNTSSSIIDALLAKNARLTKTLDAVKMIQTERKRHIEEKCVAYQMTMGIVSRPLLERFLVDDEHGLLYCYIPKVASTNWKKILMMLTKKTDVTDVSRIDSDSAHKNNRMLTLEKYSGAEIDFRLKNYMKFTFVRHPFERLVSAYNNKLVEDNSFYHMNYGRRIIRKYRKNPSKQSLKSGDGVLFAEFVQFVIDEWRTGQLMDVHWRPMVDLCTPCHIHYDVIGKFETLKQDADFVLDSANQTLVREFPQFHPAISKSSDKFYAEQLTEKQLDSILFHVYKYDFELFGYSTDL